MILTFLLASVLAASQDSDLIPTPQYLETLKAGLVLQSRAPVRIVTGARPDRKVSLAAKMIKEDFESRAPALKIEIAEAADPAATTIVLCDEASAADLNLLDRRDLSHSSGQGYVLRTAAPGTLRIVGRPQGLLYGAMTLLQLAREDADGLRIPGVYVRDFPHFEYRAAADWLLSVEAEGWSMDRGQGLAGFESLCRRKLDQCLRYKINMVAFDGFGWSLKARFPEYPALMRRLNGYARERGIHLVFGGYGANYEVLSRSQEFYNRERYPDGAVYSCMGHNGEKKEALRGVRGTCRGNDDLNRLKADELREFVRAVEPGALYIHHEDYGGTDTTAAAWKNRDDRCRRLWPNDEVSAADGGAGGLAYAYSWLVNAVNDVRNDEPGYVASRDCRIILVSPVYIPSSPSTENWSRALTLWQNVAKALPPAPNVLACFRETFPQESGPGKWSDAFNASMREVRNGLGLHVFFLGGADRYVNDYPLVATPMMNAHFLGARGLYNFSGDGYQDPQQLLNAEYDWNATPRGVFKDDLTHEGARRLWHQLMHLEIQPEEIFGDRGFLPRACRRLYGASAALPMTRYYRECRPLPPEWGKDRRSLPTKDDRLYAVPVLALRITRDAASWKAGPSELHLKLKRYWELTLEVSERGGELLKLALDASPSASSREDLEFLLRSTRVAVPLCRSLVDLHSALAQPEGAKASLERAKESTDRAAGFAAEFFPEVIDPAGAEVGALKTQIEALRRTIRQLQQP